MAYTVKPEHLAAMVRHHQAAIRFYEAELAKSTRKSDIAKMQASLAAAKTLLATVQA